MRNSILILFSLFFYKTTFAQNGIYILNLYTQNFEKFIRVDTSAYINYYNISKKVTKPIYTHKKIASLNKLYLPVVKNNSSNNYCLEIISKEDTCRIHFMDVMPYKKDTMFDLAFVAGNFSYYRNSEKRIKQVYGQLIEPANMANINDAMLRGFHLNSLQYLTNYKITEANYAPLKPLYIKKECKQDELVKANTNYYYLCNKNIKENATGVYITTTIKPKQLNNFKHYQFLYNNDIAKNAKVNIYSTLIVDTFFKSIQAKKLWINNAPFTGFLDIAYSYVAPMQHTKFNSNDAEQHISINQYQFKNGKFETANITTDVSLYTAPFRPVVEKPVLYLYPTQKQEIKIQLKFATHDLVTSYPNYNKGWNVIATPNGELTNLVTNKKHYCLYWETKGKPIVNELRTGFVIEGKNTEKFLEDKLALLGLNEREANEFIIYWLPQMESNKANVIYFATTEYENESTLIITPKPLQTIRVMMLWQPLQNSNVIFMPQKLIPTKRQKGFVAVEWGGSKVNIFRKITP